ncbi:FixH family protein [Glaciecola sp. MH2013]|uniref:FixH family protein n=1 Tax=Glaciecola sp. MH2013 TaxID=2785524 RepID=UPI00189ED1E6|nr:FixH family protein [Glaciecola sp. MH2013]MBF7072829.1 FixH family protein [Glaciecola sp. MH2013]
MDNQDIKPWYRQFYPWFLICIPVSSFIVGGIMISYATDGSDSLVIDDYYKEGKTINARLDKMQNARNLNIETMLSAEDGLISVDFLSGAPSTQAALKLDFYHVTQEQRDFQLLLSADANGVYRAQTDNNIQGKWRLRLTPLDEEWKVQQTINLPTRTPVKFVP